MICKNNFLDVLNRPYFSGKVSFINFNNNVVVFIVNKYVNKLQISSVFEKIFKVKVIKVRTLLFKCKVIDKKRNKYRVNFLKKAYIILEKNQKFDLSRYLEI